jgi:hypothetical protein
MNTFECEIVDLAKRQEKISKYCLSDEQIRAGKEIINCFITDPNGIRWAILLAQMQSGKTETYLFVCCELIRLSIVNSVVIFSGNADTDLRDQLKREIDGGRGARFYKKYDKYLQKNIYLDEDDEDKILEFIEKIQTSIEVLWGTELNKNKKSYSKTLFVWEEAHHAQSVHQCPDKFLKKIGISADGNKAILKQKDNFVLSVSATPFSEYSDFHHFGQFKQVVYMKPGVGYNSVKDILTSGRLKSFKNVETGLRTALSTPHSSSKYAIVRISKKNEDRVKEIISEFPSWTFAIFDSISTGLAKEEGERVWNGMKDAPLRDTIILLRGKCRMGKNLEKEHVLFVMETAKNSNTDTILQGLLGRVCGYSTGSNLVDVYLYSKIVDSGEIQRYINLTEGQHVIPSKACNVAKTATCKSRHPTIPFQVTNVDVNGCTRIPILSKIIDKIASPEFNFGRTDRGQFDEIKRKLVRSDPRLPSTERDHMVEIAWHDVSGNMRDRFEPVSEKIHYYETTDDSYPSDLWHTGSEKKNRINKKTGIKKEDIDEGRIINVFYYREANEKYGIEAGSAFIYGVTETQNPVYVAKTNIPKTTGREIFAHRLEDGTEVVANGGFVINLPIASAADVSVMHQNILRFAELTLEFPTSRSVNSQWNPASEEYKGIIVTQIVRNALLPGGEIFEDIRTKFGFNLTLTGPTKTEPIRCGGVECFRYASISW